MRAGALVIFALAGVVVGALAILAILAVVVTLWIWFTMAHPPGSGLARLLRR